MPANLTERSGATALHSEPMEDVRRMPTLTSSPADIAVVYLARGGEPGSEESLRRFASSYAATDPGCRHSFYVIYKNFESDGDLGRARALFEQFNPGSIHVADAGFDITAYRAAANELSHQYICFVNSHSEILVEGWLAKMADHIRRPEMGMVGATGSFESLADPEIDFPTFPNIHLRTNGFLIARELFLNICEDVVINDKRQAHLFESGPASLTRGVIARGFDVAIIGANGRAYPPRWWPSSDTFRQVQQGNLLIADNQTRDYTDATLAYQRILSQMAWGSFIEIDDLLPEGIVAASRPTVVA